RQPAGTTRQFALWESTYQWPGLARQSWSRDVDPKFPIGLVRPRATGPIVTLVAQAHAAALLANPGPGTRTTGLDRRHTEVPFDDHRLGLTCCVLPKMSNALMIPIEFRRVQ